MPPAVGSPVPQSWNWPGSNLLHSADVWACGRALHGIRLYPSQLSNDNTELAGNGPAPLSALPISSLESALLQNTGPPAEVPGSDRARKPGGSHRRSQRTSKSAKEFSLKITTFNARSMQEPGKLNFMAEQLQKLETDIMMVQETRFRDSFVLDSIGSFDLFTVPAEPHRGGLMILIRQRKGIKVIEHTSPCSRLLRVSASINGELLHFVCAHAPTMESPSPLHEQFEADTRACLAQLKGVGHIVMGVDLNARLRGLCSSVVGPKALSLCPHGALHIHPLLHVLEQHHLSTMNTYICADDAFTWEHNSGSLHQIDFLIVSGFIMAKVVSTFNEEWATFDLATSSDHCAVSAIINLDTSTATKQRTSQTRFADDLHFGRFASEVEQGALNSWDGTEDPGRFVSGLVSKAAELIVDLKPNTKKPRKPWIQDATWSYLWLLNKYRRLLTALYRDDRAQMRTVALAILTHGAEAYFPSGQTDAVSGCQEAIRLLRKVTKRLLRADRQAWFAAACHTISEDASSHATRQLHSTIRALCRQRGPRPGSRLLDPSGVVISDPGRVQAMWDQHWREHFSAQQTVPTDFENRGELLQEDWSGDLLSPDQDDSIQFSEEQVLLAIKRQPAHKATPDSISSRAYKPLAPVLAPPLCEFLNRCLRQRTVPRSYAGCRLVAVWKKKGSHLSAKQFRPIALLKLESKVFAKLLLPHLERRLRHHAAQFGSGSVVGINWPQLIVRQTAAHAKEARLPSACLFVDLSAAFDSVLKPLLWGLPETDQCTAEALSARGDYSVAQAETLARFLTQYPPILAECGLPTSLLSVLRCWNSGT
eukprot:5942609-Amphidinium_carterae.3